MKNEENKNWILDQIEKNLIVILIGAGMIYSTFHNADATTARDITEINNKLDKLDAIAEDVALLKGAIRAKGR